MDDAVIKLEETVKRTDESLDEMVLKIECAEKNICEQDTDVTVFKLLKSVTEVKNDYQNIRKELMEVQQLQRQISTSLRSQLEQVQGHFTALKQKIAGSQNDT
ncbi:uncharacterized protein LOC123301862 [Chrysoperla carnea]|uniref:uncharacterized protein LOC123301862 n=1 Tax=Chrysoperla carnea TaxID=189513 RepID=UPI001D05CA55|nr:uncharacterized protein LOC123301862 [Chrysoperla carnea]